MEPDDPVRAARRRRRVVVGCVLTVAITALALAMLWGMLRAFTEDARRRHPLTGTTWQYAQPPPGVVCDELLFWGSATDLAASRRAASDGRAPSVAPVGVIMPEQRLVIREPRDDAWEVDVVGGREHGRRLWVAAHPRCLRQS